MNHSHPIRFLPLLFLGLAGPSAALAGRPARQQPIPPELLIQEKELTFERAVFALGRVREMLKSFAGLTDYLEEKTAFRSEPARAGGDSLPPAVLSRARLKAIGNLDWESQALGFQNFPTQIEGALLRQGSELKRLEWELLRARKADAGAVAAAEKAYFASRKELDAFLRRRNWAD